MKQRKINVIFILLALISFGQLLAQERIINGNVTDETGPLPGVSVIIKGTSQGTETDFDGNYSIKTTTGDVLQFRFVGMTTINITVGTENNINVTMVSENNTLEEVVVTALGIERTSREIGYGITKIKSKDLNIVRETNVLSALNGKTSGVIVQNQSGNIGGSQRILIRGNSSLSGTVQPLFVVDGVPISNSNIATGSRITGGFDFGNRAQDINPDDVESVTVLKGASAAALYGSRASGGVIVITTKRGKAGQKASVTFNSTYRFDEVQILPNFQNQFVSGDFGVYDFDTGPNDQVTSGWGPDISDLDGQLHTDITGNQVPFTTYPNNVKNFWEQGFTAINSLVVAGASENGLDDYRLSVAYTDQKGVVPSSRLNRTNLGLNAGKTFSDHFKSRFNVNYVRTNTTGTAAQGANDPNVLTSIVNLLPSIIDYGLFNPEIDDQGNQLNAPGGQTNNPYWISRQNATETTVERFFGNASMQWLPFEGFDILGRAGYDTFTDTRALHNSIGTIGRLNGDFTDDIIRRRELTLDLIATYNKDINEDFSFTARGGIQWNERVFDRLTNTGIDLTVPKLYAPGNAATNNVAKDFSVQRIFGVFGDVTLNYKNWLILNATGRNDISSTLPASNNSFFYPSVSLSWIFTEALHIESDIFNYGKLRGSWANVGGDTGPFLLDFTFNPDSSFFAQFGTGGTFPFAGQLAFNSDGSLTDQNLGPSNQENFEFGTELGFFNNRIIIDATYYKNTTRDDILFVPTPQSTGFGAFLTNVGEVSNEGFELQINAKVLTINDFSWDIAYNFTKNDFTVVDLGGLPALNLATGFNGISVRAVEGESLQLFGPRFLRAKDADGNDIEDQILVDENGIRQIGAAENLGQIAPDFIMGFTSNFTYKGFTLSTTFDYRQGGKIFSNTVGSLRRSGLGIETLDRTTFVDPNTFTQPGGNGTPAIPNTTEVSSVQAYWQGFSNGSIIEGNVFDATFIKWRELSVSYAFSNELLNKTPFKGLQIAVQGRNLLTFNTDVPHIDPESGLGGSSSQLDGIERGGVPTTRSLGFNIIANF